MNIPQPLVPTQTYEGENIFDKQALPKTPNLIHIRLVHEVLSSVITLLPIIHNNNNKNNNNNNNNVEG